MARKVSKVRFSADDDELLIEFVQNHSILYDLKDPEFKNTMKKDLIWNEAGKVVNREGGVCKKRWKSMRDHYKREKKEFKGLTGSAAKKKRAFYWDRLRFLDVVEDERGSFTNVPTTDNKETTTSTAEIDLADLGEEEGVSTEHVSEKSSLQTVSEQTPPLLESQRSDGAVFEFSKFKRRRENVALNKYLKEKKEDREHFKRCLEELVTPVPQEKEDENDLFFKTVAATVKKFRPDLATRTKAKIFQIITEMELLNQGSPLQNTTGFKNIQYDEIQGPYSSSASSPLTTPFTSHSEASDAASDIVSEAFVQAFQDANH